MRDPRVASNHLLRDAYLYIRQSTPRQVSENGESTRRQYALRERALSLGWPAERIHIIDQDLGMSGAHSAGRDGFKELVAAVGLRKVGIVLGLEVSRLARNSVDWQQLLQLCAYTDTLILDEEGIYDPSAFNDPCLSGLHIHPPVLVFFHNRTSTRLPLAPMSWTRLSERAMRE